MTDDLQVRWGAAVRARRQERGLSLVRLARLADIDQGHLSRVERGEAGASDDLRIRLATALGVRVEELFGYPDTSSESAQAAS